MNSHYPSYESHQKAWEELAAGIASLEPTIEKLGAVQNDSKGELIIIGSGIETIGFSLGDEKLIETADKVIFCVADPATIVWIKQKRPDALDMYVLYDENKVRYTTYMQMSEAQLYYVRQGMRVVVIFYGHPGIFVLSTHRAIKIAKREGHKATMKASVSALDTLCADLGVDPCQPGMQTYEASDCLIRRRHIDTHLHVVLWQVGLIGELGFRRHGYLNSNFSYFIEWLQSIYGEEYEITHYIGSRYPTISPIIETYHLSELHLPDVQTKITGLSTFYIPPRDVQPTDFATALALGLITEDQSLITPTSPLREIDLYTEKEMKAFRAFRNFRIPLSYHWQAETEASKFLIALRFDATLQNEYATNPLQAIDDERFTALSDKERSLLATRNSASIQVASKGSFSRSITTEDFVHRIFSSKSDATQVLKCIQQKDKSIAREKLVKWANTKSLSFEWEALYKSIDFINQHHLVQWTGVYVEPQKHISIVIVGNAKVRQKSLIYVNENRVNNFTFENGVLKWKSQESVPYNGFLRLDANLKGQRQIIGKLWEESKRIPAHHNFQAIEANPASNTFLPLATSLANSNDLKQIEGTYTVRNDGIFSKELMTFKIDNKSLLINDISVEKFQFTDGSLSWKGGSKGCYEGSLTFLIDPIANSIEAFGQSHSAESLTRLQCYGARLIEAPRVYSGPDIPEWAKPYLLDIAMRYIPQGGLLLWHKWEKYFFTAKVVNYYLPSLL